MTKKRKVDGYYNKRGEYVLYGSREDWRYSASATPSQLDFAERGVDGMRRDEHGRALGYGTNIESVIPPKIEEPTVDVEAERIFTDYIIDCNIGNGPLRTTKPKTYILQRDGVYVVTTTQFAKFSKKVASIRLSGQHEGLVEGFILKIPKIPFAILNQVVSFFRYFLKADAGDISVEIRDSYWPAQVPSYSYGSVLEAFVQIYWDDLAKEYFIFVPPQTVSGASVKWKMDTSLDKRLGKASTWLVMEIHSHNTMAPSFSPVDDADEKAPIFFGVVGNLSNSSFEMTCRFGVDGIFKEFDQADLFEDLPSSISFPKEWIKRVRIRAYDKD